MATLKRNQVPKELTWDLTRIFEDDSAWQKEADAVKAQIETLQPLSETLTTSGKALYEGITKILAVQRRLEKVYVYATLSSDVDTTNSHYLGLVSKAQALASHFQTQTAFFDSSILSLSKAQLSAFEAQEPRLKVYAHFLDGIFIKKTHTLPADQEKIAAAATSALDSSANTFNVLTNSDLAYPFVEDDQGDTVQLTESLYDILIQSQDREVRQEAFQALYSTIGQFENSLASTLAGNVKAHNFNAQIHHYPDARTAALSANNVPLNVYDTLIKQVHEHLPLLHRYVALRKKILGLDDLQMFDIYVPITGKPALTYSLEEAKGMAKKALSVLGSDYLSHVDEIFTNRMIDVAANQGKVTGAYSGGSYDTDPYELLNWEDSFDALYTLVHETGHSVHSWYTRHTQPYVYGDYPIFVAEIASTTNENILTEYLLDHLHDKATRAFVLNHYLDSFKGTLFRQTQFAEFEQFIHESDAQGQPLTAQVLDDFYGKLNAAYYGPSMISGPEIAKEWARIPHFYYNFYVYQYATGFAAATTLANHVVHGSQAQRDAYLGFLKAGSSAYPTDIMKKAGVDMTQDAYLEEAFATFEKRLDEFESLL